MGAWSGRGSWLIDDEIGGRAGDDEMGWDGIRGWI